MRYTVLLWISGLFAMGCGSGVQGNRAEPPVEPSDATRLVFVPTMEQAFPPARNAVYAVSLPLAWQALRKELKVSEPVETASPDVRLLDGTKAAHNTLDAEDYTHKITRRVGGIHVETRQQVQLTFVPALEDYPGTLRFNGDPVAAFGTKHEQNRVHSHQINILAYRDDDHFAVQLTPMEPGHAVLLFKADTAYGRFDEMYAALQHEQRKGAAEREQQSERWRYALTDADEFLAPKAAFDIQHEYPQFAGAAFQVKRKPYTIDRVAQRVGFAMNEYGVSMESDAELIVHTAGIPGDELPRPKRLVFDKPFYVIMKKREMDNPYFIGYVANAELLEKEGGKK